MQHDSRLHPASRRAGYRPPHAWLGRPGDGVPLRQRKPGGGWRFRWKQARVLLLAATVAAIAWSQIPEAPTGHIAPAPATR